MSLNKTKTKEIIFRTSRMNQPISQPLDGIQRVKSLKLLGVTLQDNLSMNEHVNSSILDCSNMLYALNTLRAHGMNDEGIQEVFRAKIVSKLTMPPPLGVGLRVNLISAKLTDSSIRQKNWVFAPLMALLLLNFGVRLMINYLKRLKTIHTMFYTNCCPWNITQDITLEPENIYFASLLKSIETL